MVVSLDVCEVTWSELLCIMMRVLLRRPRAAGANRNDTLLASVYACQQQSFNSNEPLSSSSIPGCAAAAARETPCAALACSARTHTLATSGLKTEADSNTTHRCLLHLGTRTLLRHAVRQGRPTRWSDSTVRPTAKRERAT